jgi:hypothetical protein
VPVLAAWLIAGGIIAGRMLEANGAAHYLASNNLVLACPVLITAAAALMAAAGRARGWPLVALAVFACIDQSVYAARLVYRAPSMRLAAMTLNLDLPVDAGEHRVNWPLFDSLILKDIPNASGYIGPELRRWLRFDLDHRNALRAAGVCMNVDPSAETLRLKFSRVENPLPLARMVSRAKVSMRPDLDIETVDPATTALVFEDPELVEGPPGTVQIVKKDPGEFRLRTECATRQLLVIAECYHAGWQAYVDGHRSMILPVYGDFMGCVIEPGVHDVELYFRPRSFTVGKWMSGITLFVVALLYGAAAWRRRSRHAPGVNG